MRELTVNAEPLMVKRLSWPAVFAGVVLALIVHTLLNFLSLAWNLAAVTADNGVLQSVGVHSVIWLMVNNILAMIAGGWLAARFSAVQTGLDGLLHGLLMWASVSLLSMVLMLVAAGALMSGTVTLLDAALSWVGESASIVAKTSMQVALKSGVTPDLSQALDAVKQQANKVLATSQKSVMDITVDEFNQQITVLLTDFLGDNDTLDRHLARLKLRDFLIEHTNMDAAQVDQRLNDWQNAFKQLKEQFEQKAQAAKQTAQLAFNQATSTMATFSLLSFFILLSGGLAAGLAGLFGVSKRK